MSTPVGNSAANASGNGPALGYSLKLWLFILFMLICVISINMFTCFILLLKVIEILLVYTFNFGIKLCPKLPKFLTDTYKISVNKKAIEVNKKDIAWQSDKNKKSCLVYVLF